MELKIKEMILIPAIGNDGKEKSYAEDACFTSDDAIVVLDGASGLSKRRVVKENGSDANWFVNETVSYFSGISKESIDNPKEVVKNAIIHLNQKYELIKTDISDVKNYELPSAAFLMVSKISNSPDEVNISSITDGRIMWSGLDTDFGMSEPSEFLAKADDKLGVTVDHHMSLGKSFDEAYAIAMERARDVRERRNQEDTYGSFDLSGDVVSHKGFNVSRRKFKKGDMILLTTDGILRYVEIYRQASYAEFFNEAFAGSLQEIAEKVRKIERDDFDCVKYPRFKVSDDICAITIEVF